MKISYNSLKKYINTDLKPEELSVILTNIGLEVESVEHFETVKGGMHGLITGEVITCEKHPNADKLSLTTVNIGQENNLSIVCGAPNVAKGQKVIVATVGTKLYFGEEEITIKPGKIRGEVSEGMICAEDEIGIGTSHDGIIVLPETTKIGISAKDFYQIETDYIFEIGLTPNRADAASHIGVARDIAAYLKHTGKNILYTRPSIENFKTENTNLTIPVEIINPEACNRYAGVTISNIEVKESPEWLKNHLKALGLKPINNVVDITNFVLHETGQPLHAFDADKIQGKKIIVRTLAQNTPFITLDEAERKLNSNDLMICNSEEPMCIAGVFGGAKSGVSNNTKNIFIESAYFNPVFVRKTSKNHSLQTDASFRFERGVDPNGVIYALKRAALLVKEIAGGQISSEIVDVYPNKIEFFEIDILYSHVNRLIGKELPKETVKTIIQALEMEIVFEENDLLKIKVPPYRVDVTREADVIEDILRIYGYNNIEIAEKVNSTLSYAPKPDTNKLRNNISDFLTSQNFSEAMSNSLTKSSYYDNCQTFKPENLVKIMNPLSSDLNVMRQTLLFNSLEAVIRNINYKNSDIKLYEFGNIYSFSDLKKENNLSNYNEQSMFAITISGNKQSKSWNTQELKSDFYTIKSISEKILLKLNFNILKLNAEESSKDIFSNGLNYSLNNKILIEFGSISKKYLKAFDIEQEVFYADIYWNNIMKLLPGKPEFEEISKYPVVKRDLALLLDKNVKFAEIRDLAYKSEKKLLKNVNIFDVFEDKKLGENKKSYAISFYLQDEDKTLTDKQIDKIMQKFVYTFEKELSATVR
jgi:phenylalanyl-tRNA synthetase beta chain